MSLHAISHILMLPAQSLVRQMPTFIITVFFNIVIVSPVFTSEFPFYNQHRECPNQGGKEWGQEELFTFPRAQNRDTLNHIDPEFPGC